MNTLLAAAMNDHSQAVVRKLDFDETSEQGDSGVVIDETPPTINVETKDVEREVSDNTDVVYDVTSSCDVCDDDKKELLTSHDSESIKDSQLSLIDAPDIVNEGPVEELIFASGDNFGILSDFSDHNTESSTPICSDHVESFLDEIHACMISVHTLDRKMIPCKRRMVREDHPESEDLPIILKDVVECCVPNERTNKEGLLYSGLLALSTYLENCTEPRVLLAIAIAEVKEWFTTLFSLSDYNPSFYQSNTTVIVKLIYKLLLINYPSIKKEGLFALYSKSPVIYMTDQSAHVYYNTIISQLLLPRSTISIVPCTSSSPHTNTMDVRALERLIDDDVACGKLPLLVVATVGTEITGHMDNIPSIRKFCDENNIWLHASGSCVPLLCLDKQPNSLSVLTQCHSLHMSCKDVIGGSTSVVLFTKQPFYMEGEAVLSLYLPLWVILQEQGSLSIKKKVQTTYDLVLEFHNRVKHIQNLQIMEYPLTCHVVCVKYYTMLDKLPGLAEEEPMSLLMSNLTKIMCEAVEVTMLEPVTCTVSLGEDLVLKYCPDHKSSFQQLDLIMSVIVEQVNKFENSLRLRIIFEHEVESRDNFLLINDPDYPAIGAVQYLPKYLQDEDACSSVEGKEELNTINTKLVDYCAQKYTCLESRDVGEFATISVPLLSEDLDIKRLLDSIAEAALHFENNSKYLERMANIIKKGIDVANQELLMESEAQFYEKGVLRQIPWFGPMLNWVSPIEEKKIIGRSFSLMSGEIQTSAGVYNSVVGTPNRSSRTMSSASESISALSSVTDEAELQLHENKL